MGQLPKSTYSNSCVWPAGLLLMQWDKSHWYWESQLHVINEATVGKVGIPDEHIWIISCFLIWCSNAPIGYSPCISIFYFYP